MDSRRSRWPSDFQKVTLFRHPDLRGGACFSQLILCSEDVANDNLELLGRSQHQPPAGLCVEDVYDSANGQSYNRYWAAGSSGRTPRMSLPSRGLQFRSRKHARVASRRAVPTWRKSGRAGRS